MPESIAARAHRRLLHLYPRSFRLEYQDELAAVFAAEWAKAGGSGARTALALGTILDTAVQATRVHFDLLVQDLRWSVRTLRRSPGFTTTAVLVTALGVGATTATFSVTDHVLLRPLPFDEPDRLVKVWQEQTARGYPRMEPSPANYRDWKASQPSFPSRAAYHPVSANLVGEGDPERLDGTAVEAQLFAVLGIKPVLGRPFTEADNVVGAPRTAILSDALWRNRFGAEAAILGRSILIDDEPTTVVGVLPRGLAFPDRGTQLWIPTRFDDGAYIDRTNTYLRVIGRLRPAVSIEQARGEMSAIARRLEAAYPRENSKSGISLVRIRDEVSWQSRQMLWALLGAAFCVLLIACTNLANLLLARGLERRRELALRSSLGAGRERLIRQVLTESLLLAALGGALGALLAIAATPLVVRLVPTSLPIAESPGVSLRTLLFAAAAAISTGVGFGLLPALRAGRKQQAADLREGARSGVGGHRERTRAALVIAQTSLSVVLLVGCGLLMRALWRVQSTDPGFQPRGVLTMRTTLAFPKYAPVAKRQQFYDRVLTDVRALPGVDKAAYASFLPMVMRGGIWPIALDGRLVTDGATERSASLRFVTADYFATLGIPLRSGRDIADGDAFDAPWVAVVSESFVRQNFPDGRVLDRQVDIGLGLRRIVGVVGDVRVRGLERESEPQVYASAQQTFDGAMPFYPPKDLAIRISGGPEQAPAILAAARRIIHAADPAQPISDVRGLDTIVAGETASRAAQLRLLGCFAAVALALAALGLHGLLAFTLSTRLPEIGVRMALGATPRDILRLVLRQGLLQAGSGLALGVALALIGGRVLQALLAGVSPTDALAYAVAILLSLTAILAGSLVPAMRAVRVDPTRILRE